MNTRERILAVCIASLAAWLTPLAKPKTEMLVKDDHQIIVTNKANFTLTLVNGTVHFSQYQETCGSDKPNKLC